MFAMVLYTHATVAGLFTVSSIILPMICIECALYFRDTVNAYRLELVQRATHIIIVLTYGWS